MNLSKIYYIWSPSTEDIYIGSTTQDLKKRLANHNSKSKKRDEKKRYRISSNDICKYGDAEIELIEEYEHITKEELRIIENIYINNCDNAINKNKAHITKEEYETYHNKWYEEHKDDKKEYNKQYNKKNHELIKKHNDKNNKKYKENGYYNNYYQANKERLAQKQKEYRKQKNEESRKNAHLNKIKDMLENMNKLNKPIYDKRTLQKYNIKKNDDGFFSDEI